MFTLVRAASIGVLLAVALTPASATERHRRQALSQTADAARPLTISPRQGIYRRGNDIIAPGGFSAHGYGYPVATADDKRAALNARIRDSASLYGSGLDGIGGWSFDDAREAGYSNPYYGNGFNRYVGFNGVPSHLAFGPGYANRYVADHDPTDDDEPPGPSPSELGYKPVR